MADVLRLIDANANRAREALRVMEDAARFVLGDGTLAGELKRLRHDLAEALVPMGELLAHRDTPGDVGTTIATGAEQSRASVAHVAIAAGKRLSEALRAIEEYAKTLPPPGSSPITSAEAGASGGAKLPGPGVAGGVEALRYRGYELERRLGLAMRPWEPRQWRLCVLLTESLCREMPWEAVLEGAILGGADCIQVREKAMDDRARLARAKAVVAQVAGRASVVVNDRVDLALLAGAQGVHLGQQDLAVGEARKLAGRRLIVGVSTNRLAEAAGAIDGGADYVGLGPMFSTTTVDDKPNIAGPGYVRAYRERFTTPHLAVGGITPERVAGLAEAGARGVAVSSAVCGSADPTGVCRRIVEQLGG